MTALIGPQGMAVGAIITLPIGNPISAAAQPTRDQGNPCRRSSCSDRATHRYETRGHVSRAGLTRRWSRFPRTSTPSRVRRSLQVGKSQHEPLLPDREGMGDYRGPRAAVVVNLAEGSRQGHITEQRRTPSPVRALNSQRAKPQLARTGGGYSPANPLGDSTEVRCPQIALRRLRGTD
jgi:hypothetical protein